MSHRRSLGHTLSLIATALFLLALVVPLCAQNSASPVTGMPFDWSHHYVIFGGSRSPKAAAAVREDLRYWQQKVRMAPPIWTTEVPASVASARKKKQPVDWSVNLGAAASVIAPGMFPAKYTFNVNAAPDCTNDFVVFALNVAGSATQATIVAYNNLYTEPGGTGFCPGTGPTVKWAYNTGGAITTSPALSLAGDKVAWVSSANPPVLHVLTIGTTGSNGASVTSPAVAGTGNNAVDTTLSYGLAGNTRSSIFEDYRDDVAYVASDAGSMHKFKGLFRGTPTEVTTGGWPMHIIDFGSHKVAGPVFDSVSKNLYYVDDVGTFTYIREVGSTVGVCIPTGSVPPCWGQVTFALTNNGNNLIEPPTVDSSNQKVYVFLGSNNQGAGLAEVLQTTTDLTLDNELPMGEKGQNVFSGAFDHGYFTSPSSGHLYVCGYPTSGNASPVLYRFGFDGTGKMTVHDANSLALASATSITRCSPMTEFFNTTTGKDWLFAGVEAGCPSTGGSACIASFDITSGFPAAVSQARTEVGGTSGIVVDNVSSQPQASSIYFSTLNTTTCGDGTSGGGCAVKLTQSGLN